MNENMSISNAEMKVMNHIWKTGAMITVPEMLAILNEEGEEWTYPTVATFLRRLETKGILGVTKKGNKLCYFPLVSKEQYETKEAEGFVEKTVAKAKEVAEKIFWSLSEVVTKSVRRI